MKFVFFDRPKSFFWMSIVNIVFYLSVYAMGTPSSHFLEKIKSAACVFIVILILISTIWSGIRSRKARKTSIENRIYWWVGVLFVIITLLFIFTPYPIDWPNPI
jgi:hypothetical protein